MFNRFRFNRIARNIKDIKIQGATNIAKAALKAYYLIPNKITKRVLINLRPTEPMLTHVLALADKKPKKEILAHFDIAQDKMNRLVYSLIKNNYVIFTHCHSTNVIKALIYSKKKGKKFEVYNTETRPLMQGRKTARELSSAGIKVTNFVDSAMGIALRKEQGTRKVNLVLLGADALLDKAIINKVGSGTISRIAFEERIPVFIVADSWKYAHKSVQLEERDFHEVWGTKKVHVENPAFEIIRPKYIRGIISELGIKKYSSFIKLIKKRK